MGWMQIEGINLSYTNPISIGQIAWNYQKKPALLRFHRGLDVRAGSTKAAGLRPALSYSHVQFTGTNKELVGRRTSI